MFCVMIEDRHSDVDVELFVDESKAIERARKLAHQFDRHGEYDEFLRTDAMIRNGWKFYATYSCEGNSIKVLERDVS